MERVWRDYWDAAAGGLFDTARGRHRRRQGLLPARAKPVQDTPDALAQRRRRHRVRRGCTS